ncbi:MAG: hypothetical protein D6723_11095 [Acidobacteria bacterium]|nr:MAG: hypothetical protein D6723_11095 [Acidobacteriota bacterium]
MFLPFSGKNKGANDARKIDICQWAFAAGSHSVGMGHRPKRDHPGGEFRSLRGMSRASGEEPTNVTDPEIGSEARCVLGKPRGSPAGSRPLPARHRSFILLEEAPRLACGESSVVSLCSGKVTIPGDEHRGLREWEHGID